MENAFVEFININTGERQEIEIPLYITASELVDSLNEAYRLDISNEDVEDNYLCAENPIAFLKGNRTLKEFGIRNGSSIIFKRR